MSERLLKLSITALFMLLRVKRSLRRPSLSDPEGPNTVRETLSKSKALP